MTLHDNRNFPHTPAGQTYFSNLIDSELLNAVDRSRADVRELAQRLETTLAELAHIKTRIKKGE